MRYCVRCDAGPFSRASRCVAAAVALLVALSLPACRKDDGRGGRRDGTSGRKDRTAQTQPGTQGGGVTDGDVIGGTVVEEQAAQSDSPEQATAKRFRFRPDNAPDRRLRLTRINMQDAVRPDSAEIDLTPYAGQMLRVQAQRADDTWVWGAEILEHRSPDPAARGGSGGGKSSPGPRTD